ncbi:molybdenum cofactor guanylyltransferase [Calycomorphotria hydatis]|uniref:Probable molybdenum cofactor guanylyltransferase n=1 Tax=Calycomorphotria hydatis TaxID=2528027 RepID=A0A517T9R6_9PLAN|nr:molybdenum cofactor guanylyltransferase [Calycomorphotria hydatis]QDT65117.1 Molybdenum cofactor guanylyltransferase [Calycomorphotria hydatis]
MADRYPAYLLAGGQSRRFGSDKALAEWNGKPLLLHVGELLREVTSDSTVVADRAEKYVDFNLRVIVDRMPGLGPLAGLHAALCDRVELAGEGWIWLCGCDLVKCPQGLLQNIGDRASDDVDAVAVQADRWQPLPGMYHTRLLPMLEEWLADTERVASFQRLFSELGDRAIGIECGSSLQAISINSREELDAIIDEK